MLRQHESEAEQRRQLRKEIGEMVAAKDRIAALEDEAERRQVDANNELFDEFDEFDKQQWAGRSCSMANGGRRNCCTMRSSSVFFKKNLDTRTANAGSGPM